MLTRFSRLARACAELGAVPDRARVQRSLLQGTLRVRPDHLCFGEQGVYWVHEDGWFTRVLVHRSDVDVESLQEQGEAAVMGGGFDDHAFIASLPRVYRFGVEQAPVLDGQWLASQRSDGRYSVSYYAQGSPLLQLDSQQLLFADDRGEAPGFEALSWRADSERLPSPPHLDCNAVQAKLAADWNAIAAVLRALRGPMCESESCPYPDLSDQAEQLQLHLLQIDPHQWVQAQLLCPICHARQRGHQHLRQRRHVVEYFASRGVAIF